MLNYVHANMENIKPKKKNTPEKSRNKNKS